MFSRLPSSFLSALLLWSLAVGGVQELLARQGAAALDSVETRVTSQPGLTASEIRSAGLPVLEEDAGDAQDADDAQLPAEGASRCVPGTARAPGARTASLIAETLPWRARVLGAQGPPALAA